MRNWTEKDGSPVAHRRMVQIGTLVGVLLSCSVAWGQEEASASAGPAASEEVVVKVLFDRILINGATAAKLECSRGGKVCSEALVEGRRSCLLGRTAGDCGEPLLIAAPSRLHQNQNSNSLVLTPIVDALGGASRPSLLGSGRLPARVRIDADPEIPNRLLFEVIYSVGKSRTFEFVRLSLKSDKRRHATGERSIPVLLPKAGSGKAVRRQKRTVPPEVAAALLTASFLEGDFPIYLSAKGNPKEDVAPSGTIRLQSDGTVTINLNASLRGVQQLESGQCGRLKKGAFEITIPPALNCGYGARPNYDHTTLYRLIVKLRDEGCLPNYIYLAAADVGFGEVWDVLNTIRLRRNTTVSADPCQLLSSPVESVEYLDTDGKSHLAAEGLIPTIMYLML
jgi:hypothetical protein